LQPQPIPKQEMLRP